MSASGSGHINQLLHERSPYLLQHAQNPVDWFPWGEAAFERAKREEKPIFLSIGYSTCHWCHVMAHESFENEGIAQLLNESFVSIKVDREERPDIDQIYMAFLQATTGSGGWPMSVWLTPDLDPFYAGTYFPPEDRHGRPGFPTVLKKIGSLWREDRPKLMERSGAFAETLNAPDNRPQPGEVAVGEVAAATTRSFLEAFDETNGGFGNAPKFPRGASFDFLLREAWHLRGEEAAQPVGHAVCHTLDAMCRGGIRDHLGGGFHRYSVDTEWHVPHFEKMLYDQAQIGAALLEAYTITGWKPFAQAAEELVNYVARDLRAPRGGGYLSAEDADSLPTLDAAHGQEGAYYVWTAEEIRAELEAGQAKWVAESFGVEETGNVERAVDPHGELTGKNVFHLVRAPEETGKATGNDPSQWRKTLNRLESRRRRRPKPSLDDKVLAAWNGLMIGTTARASLILEQPEMLDQALEAANFLRENLFDDTTGTLYRSYRGKRSAIPGFADDYACLIHGILELFQITGKSPLLEWALVLQQTLDDRFRDEASSAYFSTEAGAPDVIVRMMTDHDGAEPAASSVAVGNLRRFAALTGDDHWREQALATVQGLAAALNRSGTILPRLLGEARMLELPPQVALLTGPDHDSQMKALLSELYGRFNPALVALRVTPENQKDLARLLPAMPLGEIPAEEVAVRLCESMTCRPPVREISELRELLSATRYEQRWEGAFHY